MEVAMETGTLKELNLKPGDVVEYAHEDQYIVCEGNKLQWSDGTIKDYLCWDTGQFTLVSRAPTPDLTAVTTPFGLLDAATQEALRAHGGPYEMWDGAEWDEGIPSWYGDSTYRVQPKPESETITCNAYVHPSGIISKIESDTPQPVRVTFNRINGVIDLASYKVEPR